jgi:uncharacterized protein (DUF427 family)
MKAYWNERVIADSDDTIVVEGNHYFPPGSVNSEYLTLTQARSLCPWKGVARYYTLEVEGEKRRHVGWTYRHPFPWVRKIRNHVAFWNGIEVRA